MFLKRIEKSYAKSIKDYHIKEKSYHWKKRYDYTKKLYRIKNLKNFRNNNLSNNLDDKHEPNKQKLNFEKFKLEVPWSFFQKFISKKNIGNNKYFFYHKGFKIDSNEIFIIKWLYDLKDYIFLKKNKIFCEIGAGYGALASMIQLNTNCKYIIIDLPEALFLSAYFLNKNFNRKKICLYSDLKSQNIDKKILNEYDIFVLPPWVKFNKDINFDFVINTRSFSEMNYFTINKYFDLINKHLREDGFFLNINRYEKSTVGHSIKFYKFPYNSKWKKLISKKSWNQDNIHFLLTKKINFFSFDMVFVKLQTYFEYLNIFWRKKINKIKSFFIHGKRNNFYN